MAIHIDAEVGDLRSNVRQAIKVAESAGVPVRQIDALAVHEYGNCAEARNAAKFAKLVRDATARECIAECEEYTDPVLPSVIVADIRRRFNLNPTPEPRE